MLKEQIYKELVNRISYLKLKPGQPVIVSEIARELGVSITPVREAFIRLSYERLIDIFPQSGTFISLIDLKFVQETVFMRHILEKEILLKSCRKLNGVIPIEIETNCKRQREALNEGYVETFLQYDNAFHRLLFGITENESIWDIIEGTNLHYTRLRYLYMSKSAGLEHDYNQHLEILSLLKHSDFQSLEKLLHMHHFFQLDYQNQLIGMYPDYFIKHGS